MTIDRQSRAIDRRATEVTRARYDRLARCYDVMEWVPEHTFARWRAELWGRAVGPRILEVGVGTGKNIPFYPTGASVTAIDISPRMLERAQENVRQHGTLVDLQEADVQALPFPDGAFDSVVATFAFCSVPDPMLGLHEARRVLAPEGHLLLIEHACRTSRY